MRIGSTIPNIIDLATGLDVSASGCTEPKCFTQVYFARMDVCVTGIDGTVVLCLETSIDGVKWTPHNACSKFEIIEDTGIKIGDLDGLWYRVCVKADEPEHTATTGTIDVRFLLKDR